MSVLLQDLRYVSRALAKRPLYALTTIAVFALAIGANSTVFGVLNALLLRPLPYPDDDRLVMVYTTYPKMGLEDAVTSIPDYLDWRDQARSLESLAMIVTDSRRLQGESPSEQISIASASPFLFGVLGVVPAIGRAFDESEAVLGNDRVIILSHRLWRTRFGTQTNVLGRDVRLDGEAYRVIGVMPEGFNFFEWEIGAWLPFAFAPEQASEAQRSQTGGISVGRLRDGATIEGGGAI